MAADDPQRNPDDPEDDGADSVEPEEEEGEGEGEVNEPAGDDEGGEEEQEELEVRPRPSRESSQRIREAAERAQALERQNAELAQRQRDLDYRESQRREAEAKAEKAKEDELIAGMSPQEQAMYTMAKRIVSVEKNVQQSTQQSLDRADKAEFARYESDPRFKKLIPEVERGYQQLRAQGTQISRVAVLDYLLGKQMREKGEAAGTRQRTEGASRVRQARGTGGSTRSNVSGSAARTRTVVDRAEKEDWII